MTSLFARDALLPDGWARDVRIDVDAAGNISSVAKQSAPGGAEKLAGPVLPGMANLHSHAFQRAMAGLAEVRGPSEDDFWTWRDLMYQFVERLTPERAQAVATHLYIDMLKHGYTAVGEFHYVHDNTADMLLRHLAAAKQCGIAITLLPSLYRWSNFGKQPLQPRQQRFDSSAKSILAIFENLYRQKTPDINVGVAPHSLRAVDHRSLQELIAEVRKQSSEAPIHIHAAEQTKEVDDSLAELGKRPVEWLLENMNVDGHWCLVHATHMTPEEATALARSGATAGLCPTTEGNLGDGIFPLLAYREAGGSYGIGGDSHVSRDPAEELRLLEYVQRLTTRRRNLVVGTHSSAVGTTLWLEAAAGAKALGRRMGGIATGMRADLVVLDAAHPDLVGRSGDLIANALIFSGATNLVRDVMVGGNWVVRERRHAHEESARGAYVRTVTELLR